MALLACPVAVGAQEARTGPQRLEPNRGGALDLASMDPDVALRRLKVADGYEVTLFASEREFPELGKAVAAKFDGRGRLWVATMPTYPHQVPGLEPNDKLLILEDSDRDGRADKVKVFADHLYLPEGFELGDGGVYVSQQPNLMFLRDTNGDDKADERRIVLHGFGTEDSHHAIHAFTWSPGGTLHFQEGTFLHSQVETPYGPRRVEYAAVWEYEPRSEKLNVFVSYPFANPWGHAIDRWGQNFISDASNGNNHFGTAFSGHVDYPVKQKVMREWTTGVKMRPTCDVTFVSSRQFPDEAQGRFLVTNVIGFQGIKQYRVTEDGSGFLGTELEPLLQSTDPNFRPVDMEFGPDGALYVVDWINPLIGHMQYSVRDPNRDKTHGRIWRIAAKGRPVLTPVAIDGQSIAAQLDLLKAYEDTTRYRARRALREHPTEAVVSALAKWIAGLAIDDKDYEHQLLEALWVYQQHDVVQTELLTRLLQAQDARARAAAVRVLQHWLDRVPDRMTRLWQAANDPAPRVRLEAVRALSFVSTKEAADTALEVLKHPTDYYIEYALDSAMTTLEKAWRPALLTDAAIDARSPRALGFLLGRLAPTDLAALPPSRMGYQALLARPDIDRAGRQLALEGLVRLDAAPAGGSRRSVLGELVAAIERIDGTPGSSVVTLDLIQMLAAAEPSQLSASADALRRLASAGRNDNVRRGALVGLLRAEAFGGAPPATTAAGRGAASNAEAAVDRAWQIASDSPRMQVDLLASAPLIAEPSLLTALYRTADAVVRGDVASVAEPASGTASVHLAPVRGRYVRVLLPGRESLVLGEVEAFSGGINVAPKGQATQSSVAPGRQDSGAARYANDGRRTGDDQGAGISVTTRERDPWWEVDLGSMQPLDTIVIWSPLRAVGGPDEDYRTPAELAAAGLGPSRRPPVPPAFQVVVQDESRKPVFMADGFVLASGHVTVTLAGRRDDERRAAAVTALGYVPGHDAAIFPKLVAAVSPASTRLAAIDALRRRPATTWPAGGGAPLADALVAAARETPRPARTDAAFTRTLDFAREVAGSLPPGERERITAALEPLTVKTITISAVPSQMKFDLAAFTVAPGQELEIVFRNPDEMPHNLLITAPGALESVSLAAEAMMSQPDAFAKHFVPESKNVLFSTPLINPHQSGRWRFTVPDAPDDYPFVCTFPGHWRTMNGVMKVTRPQPSTSDSSLQKR